MDSDYITMARRLPPKFEKFERNGIHNTPAFAPVIDYLLGLEVKLRAGVGLLLSGPNGCGKTGALAVIHKEVKRIRPQWGARHIMWCKASDIAMTYEHYKYDEVFDDPVDDLYNTAKWLVVDELGRETHIKNYEHRMQKLLRSRIEEGVITSFTTNLSLNDDPEDKGSIVGIYGTAFWSLMCEACDQLVVDGPDRRKGQ